MSLVNQMLKDLEARRAPEMGGEAVLRDLAVGAPPSARHRAGLLTLAAAVLVAAGGAAAAAYWYTHRAVDTVAIAEPVVVASAAAAAKADVPQSAQAPQPPQVVQPTSAAAIAEAPPAHHPDPAPRTKPPRPARVADAAPPAPAAAVREKTPPAPRAEQSRAKAPAGSAQADEPAPVVERVERPQTPRERARAAYLRGSAWVKRGRLSEAETVLRNALALDPDLSEAREVLAAVLIRTQRSDAAEAVLKAGLDRNHGAYTLARMQARLLTGRNATAEAIRVLERSLPAPELDADYYGLLAALYQRAGEHEKAAEAYRRVLAVAPGRGVWWMGLGISLERLGQADGALQAYRRARASAGMSAQLLAFVDARIADLAGRQ